MTFEYHRRIYAYDTTSGQWSKIRCRTNFPLRVLDTWTGFPSTERIVAGQIRYGPNLFSVKQPQFWELYKAQLLNPFSVFQVFCVLLWAIDDYIIYSFFSLFMVLLFEGTVVFQRLRSLQALRGMGNPSRTIYVLRLGRWTPIDSAELLPGDVMSLTRVKPHLAKSQGSDVSNTGSIIPPKRSMKVEDDGGDVVPADLLLLRGSSVVNEASLTGESVPQMKEGLTELSFDECLEMKDKHRMNVVYAGTKMLVCKGGTEYLTTGKVSGESEGHLNTATATSNALKVYSKIPSPPDNGCVCFVLRTGFASAQGKLVRMIEGSQEQVKGHERETGLLLLVLCFFATISSGYVLYHGAKNEKRSKYELLLHCIMIITNVIRPELPMQMAMAVNNSLMTLMKMNVFCTEPYRVPMAGKLDSCLFDKTGTLTTDELVAVGICEPVKLNLLWGTEEDEASQFITVMSNITNEAALVLAGCHSLVVYDGETTGDPLESASLRGMRWKIDSENGHAVPMPATSKKPAGRALRLSGSGVDITQVEIIVRHHFSSKLQRMSCVARATGGRRFALCKGSPEAIGRLLAIKPAGFDEKSEYLSKQGYRVIGLAYKPLETEEAITLAIDSRAACEEGLTFAGFMIFTCMVRKDTAAVLNRLKEGGMSIAMVTGDALMTAIHVAKEVKICELLNECRIPGLEPDETSQELKRLLLEKAKQKKRKPDDKNGLNATAQQFRPILYLKSDESDLFWCSYEDGSRRNDFKASLVPALSKSFDLAITGKCLEEAFDHDPETSTVLQYIKVFARMTPDAKEKVIECFHSIGLMCLMCGDGANDVGALKQADVGVALLSGFGNLNVETKDAAGNKDGVSNESAITAIMSQDHLDQIRSLPISVIKMKIRQLGTDPDKYPDLIEKEDLIQLYQIKAREVAVKKHDQKNKIDAAKMTKSQQQEEQKKLMMEKQAKMMQRAQELEEQGVQWATFKAMREMYAHEMEEAKKKKGEMTSARGIEGSAALMAAQIEDMETGDLPMIKLGDASIAAPFTSKMPSIRNCVDIVRQGRCTLVSSIQMYQIMALQCLISSYSLSVLYFEGVKYGDAQYTAMGMLGSVSSIAVSRSKPLDKLSRVRPLNSIFHPALFASLMGQFAIHLLTMYLAVQAAKEHLPPDYEPDLDGVFKPGILNTVVFLVINVQQCMVYFVNLQGRPFMTSVTENTPLLWSLAANFILTFMFANESVPGLNRYFQLVPFPDHAFRDYVLKILAINLVATFSFDRFMQFIFSRDILMASLEGTTSSDVFTLLKTFAIIGFLMTTFMGDSDSWDQLLAMESNTTEWMKNRTGIAATAVECIGDACDAAVATMTLSDEF